MILVGDNLPHLRAMADNSVDAIVTDPPYGLAFMGKKWDYDVPSVEVWAECLRVLKPGGHLLAFAGTRTQHRMACRIEDAGFEIRDMIAWLYGSGFPKSLDVSKAIDKMGGIDAARFKAELAGAVAASGMTRAALDAACGFTMRFDVPYEKDPGNWGSSVPSPEKWAVIASVLGVDPARWQALVDRTWRGRAGAAHEADSLRAFGQHYDRTDKGEPTTDAARQWEGWGTALKPAMEPITVARKPLTGTVAANVLAHGTGALNIDGCRVATEEVITATRNIALGSSGSGVFGVASTPGVYQQQIGGRWPANICHDGSDEVLAAFPQAPGQLAKASTSDTQRAGQNTYGVMTRDSNGSDPRQDAGSAARFFYCAKASKADRNEGCDALLLKASGMASNTSGDVLTRRDGGAPGPMANNHPTVKPTALMRYLCRLVTPPGGLVLDPFVGSGSTGKAAALEGFQFIGIEQDLAFAEIAKAREAHAIAAYLDARMKS